MCTKVITTFFRFACMIERVDWMEEVKEEYYSNTELTSVLERLVIFYYRKLDDIHKMC